MNERNLSSASSGGSRHSDGGVATPRSCPPLSSSPMDKSDPQADLHRRHGPPGIISQTSDFPTFTFPDAGWPGAPGTIVSASVEDFSTASPTCHFQHSFQADSFLRPLTRLNKVIPRAYYWSEPPNIGSRLTSRFFRKIEGMISYWEANHFDSFVPREILAEHLRESLDFEHDRRRYDPFAGNMLNVIYPQGRSDSFPMLLAHAGGSTSADLHLTPLIRDGPIFNPSVDAIRKDPVLRFNNPIRQIASSELNPGSLTSSLLAVRTYGYVSIVGADYGDDGPQDAGITDQNSDFDDKGEDETAHSIRQPRTRVISTLSFARQPCHVVFNPYFGGEAAIVMDGGGVCTWDAGLPEQSRTSLLQDADVDFPDAYEDRWKTCEYGAHPRTLFVAHSKRVDMVDFRMPQTRFATVLLIPDADRIYAFERSLGDRFQSVYCTSKRVALFDSRFSTRSVLEWEYNNVQEPPSGVVMANWSPTQHSRNCTLRLLR
ncbi:hypothetical protein BDK51DRAFT_44390 [Blyttiomyces helicus]|uniref:TAF1C beta-propeller domain-containing protein n=1 Tax=Blyttiomyces helicus TaxID=388810 RepID=A0A4P9W556_9FUNG|nr:hypothetical protein BDK51DRAFT_44390 [Blyttiomyces helicus]|eukprot:RKO87364.1 hypothetical protein BDK51DRAFT_44390 [Blyttiomyces helicus]